MKWTFLQININNSDEYLLFTECIFIWKWIMVDTTLHLIDIHLLDESVWIWPAQSYRSIYSCQWNKWHLFKLILSNGMTILITVRIEFSPPKKIHYSFHSIVNIEIDDSLFEICSNKPKQNDQQHLTGPTDLWPKKERFKFKFIWKYDRSFGNRVTAFIRWQFESVKFNDFFSFL